MSPDKLVGENDPSTWVAKTKKAPVKCTKWFLFCIQNKTNQGQKVVSPVLNRAAKWAIFVLHRVKVWRPWGHPPTQTSSECPPPPPSNKHSIYLKILIVSRLSDYLSTNCTLTWGFSHCRLLIYSGMKSRRFQLREKRDGHANSKWKKSAVLYRAVTSLVFCMLLVFVKYAHWPLTYFSPHRPRKGHSD